MLSIGANVGMHSKVVGLTRHKWILVMSEVWDHEKILRYNHTRGHSRAELLYLVLNID